jgi:transcriptional regulator with XRE-family HTH domain
MYFETLQGRLLDCIRKRVQNGEVTERRLAGMSGISQPHIHNLLKGARGLSPGMADRILRTLDMSVFDLLAPEEDGVSGPAAGSRLRGEAGIRWLERGNPSARRQPRWLNRGGAGTLPPRGRSPEPAWPSGTN